MSSKHVNSKLNSKLKALIGVVSMWQRHANGALQQSALAGTLGTPQTYLHLEYFNES